MNQDLKVQMYRSTHKFKTIDFPKVFGELSRMESMILIQCASYKEKHGKYPNISLLCDPTNVSVQSMSRTIKKFEEKGFVVRETDKENRRNTIIKVTEKGEMLLKRQKNVIEQFWDRVLSHFSDEEIIAFIQFEEKLCEIMKDESKKFNESQTR